MGDPLISNHFRPFIISYLNHSNQIISNDRYPRIPTNSGCSVYTTLSAALMIDEILTLNTLSLPQPEHFHRFYKNAERLKFFKDFDSYISDPNLPETRWNGYHPFTKVAYTQHEIYVFMYMYVCILFVYCVSLCMYECICMCVYVDVNVFAVLAMKSHVGCDRRYKSQLPEIVDQCKTVIRKANPELVLRPLYMKDCATLNINKNKRLDLPFEKLRRLDLGK